MGARILFHHVLKLRCHSYLRIHTTSVAYSYQGYKLGSNLKDSYLVLRVDVDADDEELRQAYIKLAKEYHPDSGTNVADADKFSQLQEAYRAIKAHRIASEARTAAALSEEEEEFRIKHKAPQHRQYLNNEGVGYGTPSERQRQYQQHRAARAQDAVLDRHLSRIGAEYETAMITRDKKATKKRMVRSGIERVVEDLIAEAMARGDFDNLPGMGKPLPDRCNTNPMVDPLTYNLNKIVINTGFAPEWITLNKDILAGMKAARELLEISRIKAGPEPLSPSNRKIWNAGIDIFKETVMDINKKVDRLNFMAPSMYQQMVPYNPCKAVEKTNFRYNEKVRKGETPSLPQTQEFRGPANRRDSEKISLSGIWKDWKTLFQR